MYDQGLVRVATPDEVAAMEQAAEAEAQKEQAVKDAFASDLQNRWQGYRDARREIEDEWLDALRANKGEYNPEQQKIMADQEALSRVYVKLTTTKCNTAYSRIVDLLFGQIDAFWDVVPSPLAEIPAAIRKHIRMMAIQEMMQFPGIHPQVRAQLTEERTEEMERGVMAEALERAEKASMAMHRQIKDYLNEADALTHCKQAVREQVVLGTGCIKMATIAIREKEKWEEGENGWDLAIERSIVPDMEYVSVFDMYPDPWAKDIGKPNDLFRRHVLVKHELRKLKDIPGFDKDAIDQTLSECPTGNHESLDYERELRTINESDEHFVQSRRYDVLEYWGAVDGFELQRYGLDVDEHEEYQANVWICNGNVLMARLNPLKPEAIPYKFVPYEKALHRFWGVGIPYMMNDSQDVMNATARALLDNAALTAGPMFQMDVSKLPEGTSLDNVKKIHPYRLWFYDGKQGEGPMVQSINIQSNQSELSAIFEMFRRFADEETSLPSYTHGEQTQSMNKTASGMSMLMTAANVALKSVVKNIDDYMIVPLIESYYHFAMRWSDADTAKRSDIDIVPMGSTALVAKELQSQRMMQALQITMNPVLGPMTDHRYLLQELFKSLDIDNDKAMRPEEESVLNALEGNGSQGVDGPDGGRGVPSPDGVSGAPQARPDQTNGERERARPDQGDTRPNPGIGRNAGNPAPMPAF